MDVDWVILRIFKCAVHNADCSAAAGHLHKVSRTNAGSSASFIVAEIYIIQCNVFGKLSYHTKCMQKMQFIAGSSQGSGCHIKSLYMSDIVRITPVCLSGVWADIAAPGNGCSAYGIIITFWNI